METRRRQNDQGIKNSILKRISYQNKNELSYEQFHAANKRTNDMLNSIVHANVYAKKRTQNRGYFSHPSTLLIESIEKLKDDKTGLPCSRDAHDNIIIPFRNSITKGNITVKAI